ncbi:MAG: hypothetical protein RR827_09505, partial [Oscillospiraceae bacterium]
MKKIMELVLSIVCALGLISGVCYYNADKVLPPMGIKINIDDVELEPSGVNWETPVLDDFTAFGNKIIIPKGLKDGWVLSKNVAVDRNIVDIKSEGTAVTAKIPYPHNIVITDPEGEEIYQG